jgi:hypothetical protein
MSVCCKCCLFSRRGVCDELTTRPEDSCQVWCVVKCDLETSRIRRPWPPLGHSTTKKVDYDFVKSMLVYIIFNVIAHIIVIVIEK